MKNFKRAILFANGDFKEHTSLVIRDDDFLVAVDGGLRHLITLQLTPHLIIGDLDSVTPQDLDLCIHWGVEIQRFPPKKDQTDLELAVLEVLRRGFTDILITAVTGGRLDHTVGNLAILALPQLSGTYTRIVENGTTIYHVNDQIDLETYPGALVSLLPWGDAVTGVNTSGLQYALNDAILYPWRTLGLSNVATCSQVSVSVKSGQLFLFHIRENPAISEEENRV